MKIFYKITLNLKYVITLKMSATRYYKAYGNEQALKETEELVTTLLSINKTHK